MKIIFAEKKIEPIFALTFWGFSSAGSEHLPYKQRVGGSNPSTPTDEDQGVRINLTPFLFLYLH
jgi:hypothetical protein